MTSLQNILTQLESIDTEITFEIIKKSFDGLNHDPKEKIDFKYYEVLRDCLNVCTTNKDKDETEAILKLFLSVKFSDGSTLLHNLMKEDLKENLEPIELLINISSPKQLDAEEKTLLHLAAENGKLDVVKLLIQKKAVSKKKANLEYYAALRDCLKICQNVLNDKNNDSSVDKKKVEDILKLSLSVKFQDVNNLLHLLIIKEDLAKNLELIKLTKLLINISSSEELNAQNLLGMTPLHYAVSWNRPEIIQSLIESEKADINAKDKIEGKTPLHLAVKYGKLKVVELLIKLDNIDINAKDELGMTPLHYATSNGVLGEVYAINLKVVKLLIEKKANVNEQDEEGYTPLYWAVRYGHKEMVESLIIAGDEVNDEEQLGCPPLHVAASYGHCDVVKLLIKEYNAKVTDKDHSGRTPLHVAASYGHCHVVKLLIKEYNAKVTDKDHSGRTPLDYAKSLDAKRYPNKQNIIDLLEKELSKYQAKSIEKATNACYTTAMLTTITATTLFTTGKIAPTQLNIIYAAGIIALSTFIITNLVYGAALEIYSTPSPKLENTEVEKNMIQIKAPAS